MAAEWLPNAPASAAAPKPAPAPARDFIECDSENPPIRELLDDAIAIKDRLDSAREGRSRV